MSFIFHNVMQRITSLEQIHSHVQWNFYPSGKQQKVLPWEDVTDCFTVKY